MLKKFKNIGAKGASGMTTRGKLFGRFAKNDEGVAAVEFALLAPLMLTLMLGALELTQSIWADGKVEQATSTIGDLVSRTPLMSDAELQALGEAGPLIMRPNPENNLEFTVTSIMGCKADPDDPDSDLEYYILWSKKWVGSSVEDSDYTIDTLFTKQPDNLDIIEGDTLIVTEGFYTYEPTITRKVGQTWDMGGYSFHQPRAQNKRIEYPGLENPVPQTCDDYRGT